MSQHAGSGRQHVASSRMGPRVTAFQYLAGHRVFGRALGDAVLEGLPCCAAPSIRAPNIAGAALCYLMPSRSYQPCSEAYLIIHQPLSLHQQISTEKADVNSAVAQSLQG